MTRLPINEVFQTIQGEARFTGTPAVFVRLQGCGVGCPWCDTKHTWFLRSDKAVPLDAMLAKVADAPTFAWVDADTLVSTILARFAARHVVFTGGEPCEHDLTEVTRKLNDAGRTTQVETSGTERIRVSPGTHVTVSPKIGMPGGKNVRRDALHRADEIKMPVGKAADIIKLEALLGPDTDVAAQVWLQPLSRSPKATELCIAEATAHGWNVSIQTHALIGVR